MIYWIEPSNDHESTGLVHDEDMYLIMDFDGTPRAATWRPPAAYCIRDHRAWRPADFPYYSSHAPVMRQRAVDVLGDMLEASGEILPLASDEGTPLYVLNVTRVIDALDEERSTLAYFKSSGRVMDIEAAAFHEDLVRGVDIFQVPLRASRTFVSQRFVDRVREAGLVGMEFQLAWSPEGGALRRR